MDNRLENPGVQKALAVSKLAQVFTEAVNNDPGNFAEHPHRFCDNLDLPGHVAKLLYSRMHLELIDLHGLVKSILEEYVKRDPTKATLGGILYALQQSELNSLEVALKDHLKLPEGTRLSIDIGGEEQKDLVQRYVPVVFQLPSEVEVSCTFNFELQLFNGSRQVAPATVRQTLIPRNQEIRELTKIHGRFREGSSSDAVVLVTGNAGVGKATFVANYCRLVQVPYCMSIIWLQYGNEFEMARQILKLQIALGITVESDDFDHGCLYMILAGLAKVFKDHREVPILLVLEDVNTEDYHLLFKILQLLHELPPPKAFVILTSTNSVYSRFQYDFAEKGRGEGGFGYAQWLLQPARLEIKIEPLKGDDTKFDHWKEVAEKLGLFQGGYLPLGLRLSLGLPFSDREGPLSETEGASNITPIIRESIGCFAQSHPASGCLLLFIINFLFPAKRFPYEALLDIFKCMWARIAPVEEYEQIDATKCWDIKNSDDEYEYLTLESDDEDEPFFTLIKKKETPEDVAKKAAKQAAKAQEKNRKEALDIVAVSKIVGEAFKTLEALGVCKLHKTINKPNNYSVPWENFSHYVELHPKTRESLITIMTQDEYYHGYIKVHLQIFCDKFSKLSGQTKDYLSGHREAIVRNCSQFPSILPFLLGAEKYPLAKQYPEMNHDYVMKLRELTYVCFVLLVTAGTGAMIGINCLRSGIEECFVPLAIPLVIMGIIGVATGLFGYVFTKYGRLHPPTLLGKVVRAWEEKAKPYMLWVTVAIAVMTVGLWINTWFVDKVVAVLGVFAGLVASAVFVRHHPKQDRGRRKKRVKRKIKVKRELLPRKYLVRNISKYDDAKLLESMISTRHKVSRVSDMSKDKSK